MQLALAVHDVREAEVPADAIAVARDPSQRVDLLLADVMMPLMSGPEVAARVRSVRPGLPVLLMSGYAEESIGALSPGGAEHGFIANPFTKEQLGREVRAALDEAKGGSPD